MLGLGASLGQSAKFRKAYLKVMFLAFLHCFNIHIASSQIPSLRNRERERERDRQTDRQTDRQRTRKH